MSRLLAAMMALAALSPTGHPAEPAVDPAPLQGIEPAVTESIQRGELPGAVVAVLHDGRMVYRKAIGQRSRMPGQEPVAMTTDTVFDLASLTKPLATAASVMVLMEQGKLRPSDRVALHWPAFAANGKEAVTVEQLLLHTSGLIADNPVSDYADGREKALERVAALKLEAPPGTRFRYSDVGYIVLGELVERVSGRPLDQFAREHLLAPMGLTDTGYRPPEALRARAAPADRAEGRWLLGEVHDPRARAMGGVAGHAGLFSTVEDLLTYARMLLDGGTCNGRRIFKTETVAAMTKPRPVPGGLRSWGWDVNSSYSANRGSAFPRETGFGHTGFTGTSIWVDPTSRTAVVFLSNRLHPDTKGNVTRLRGRVATLAAEAVGVKDVSPRKGGGEKDVAPPSLREKGDGGLGKTLTGIDVLARENFARLKGKRVGLVTNHSGRDRDGRATIDLLHQAEGVKLVALFSPEHGIRGAVDEKVSDSTDEKTGLPVFSLYGQRYKPTPESLQGIDTLVYDVQDAGCRYYTYISTLGNVLEAAAAAKIRLVVLDRPNPIGGVAVAGPVLDAGRESFVGWHRLPVRHGLTVGELARLFNSERRIGCDLEVVTMEGWRRSDFYDRTGLTWVNPSPNLRNLTEALLYPGIGLLETTNLSVGRGTDQPFEWFGAPWLDGRKLADALRRHDLPGVRWVPVSRTPTGSVFKGQACGGVQIVIDDWSRFEPLRTGLTVAAELRRLYPDAWQIDRYDRLLGNRATLEGLKAGRSAEELERAWQPALQEFLAVRKQYLLYN
jgi:uncharacterized protein YbbC (DUF1343 family)/CubicO group peptidase (beta-lactamase class C family)